MSNINQVENTPDVRLCETNAYKKANGFRELSTRLSDYKKHCTRELCSEGMESIIHLQSKTNNSCETKPQIVPWQLNLKSKTGRNKLRSLHKMNTQDEV